MTSLLASSGPRSRSIETSGKVVAGASILILALAPIAWGCVDPKWHAVLTALLCAIGTFCLGSVILRRGQIWLTPGSVPLIFFVLFAFAQTLPIGNELSIATGEKIGITEPGSISLIPAITLSRARSCLGLLVLFLVGSTLLSQPHPMRRLPWTILIIASVLAVYHSVHPFLEHVPGRSTNGSPFMRHVFGTYLNRNHLAAFFVIAFLMGTGLFVSRRRVMDHRAAGFSRRQVYILMMLAMVAIGLVVTNSRGGLVSLLFGIVGFTLLLYRRSERRRRWVPLVCTGLVLCFLPLALPAELMTRFMNAGRDATSATARAGIWDTASQLFSLSPLLGNGLGTFGELSVLQQTPDVVGHVEHAHSDPLEFLAETGLIGVNLLLWAWGLLMYHVVRRGLQTRGDRRTVLVCASGAAILAVSIHSLVDFNFQIPALAAWVAMLGGSASGALASANGLPRIGRPLPAWALMPAIVLLSLSAVFAAREAWSLQLQDLAHRTQDAEATLELLADAEIIHPGRGEAPRRAAWLLASAEESPRDAAGIQERAIRAIGRNPFDAEAWHLRAIAEVWLDHDSAVASLARAIELIPPSDRPHHRTELGLILLEADRPTITRQWFHELFHDPDVDPIPVLQRLSSAATSELDLTPLIPADAKDALRRYADVLLAGRELSRREAVLDLLWDRLPNTERRTVKDEVTLVRRSVTETNDAEGHRLVVELEFVAPEGYRFDTQLMCLDLNGPDSGLKQYFQPELGTTRHVVSIPRYLPPGTYELALQPFTNGVRFPLSIVTIERSELHLTPGRTWDAREALYQSFRGARSKAPEGLQLVPDSKLFRPVRVSREGGTLLITCAASQPIAVRFNGLELTRLNTGPTREHRFPLPAGTVDGTLEIFPDPDSEPTTGAPIVEHITLLAERPR